MRNLFLLFFIVLCQISFAQNNNLKFVPSNIDPSNVNPSDIPSEQVLRQMGLGDEEISEALDLSLIHI